MRSTPTDASASNEPPPYLDPERDVDDRVADLLGRMTFDEKVQQLRGAWPAVDAYVRHPDGAQIREGWLPLISDPPIGMAGSIFRADPFHGITLEAGLSRREGAQLLNAIQRWVEENTRLAIPVFVTDDGHRGQQAIGATMFPQLCGMGATWNVDLQRAVAGAMAAEARSQGVHIVFAPNLDVVRDPRFGRSDQCFGEDPWLVSRMGEAWVQGLQGESLRDGRSVVAMLRAYPGLGDAEGGRDFGGFSLGIRELHEVVLRPWEAGVRAGAQGIMVEQMVFDGEPVPASRFFLTTVLRDQWGFQGIALDDNGGIERLVDDWRVAADRPTAAAMAMRAGNDLALSDAAPTRVDAQGRPRAVYTPAIVDEAISRGLLTQEEVDRSVSRVLRIKFLLGLFEHRYCDPQRAESIARSPAHMELALQAARESIVLLKNESDTLPLAQGIRTIAVVGPNADETWNQLGDYAHTHAREEVVTILDGVRTIARTRGIDVRYAKGCGIRSLSRDGIAEAVAAAKASDVVIAVVGGSSRIRFPDPGEAHGARSDEADTGETVTHATLELLGVQTDLVEALKATGKPVVVVLVHGRAYAMGRLVESADALVDAFFPGEAGGTAVAEVLFGMYNPGGRLAVSVPRHVGQGPVCYYSHNSRRRERVRNVDVDPGPLFPFGYGLSYASFAYDRLYVEPSVIAPNETAEVRVDVVNVGEVAGDEVVQLYVRDEEASVVRPERQLRGFARVHLSPGERRTVVLELGPHELSFFGPDMAPIVEPGEFTVMIGRNAAETIVEAKLTVAESSTPSAEGESPLCQSR